MGHYIALVWRLFMAVLSPLYVLYAVWLVVVADDVERGIFWILVALFFLVSDQVESMRAAGRRRAVTRVYVSGDQLQRIEAVR